ERAARIIGTPGRLTTVHGATQASYWRASVDDDPHAGEVLDQAVGRVGIALPLRRDANHGEVGAGLGIGVRRREAHRGPHATELGVDWKVAYAVQVPFSLDDVPGGGWVLGPQGEGDGLADGNLGAIARRAPAPGTGRAPVDTCRTRATASRKTGAGAGIPDR